MRGLLARRAAGARAARPGRTAFGGLSIALLIGGASAIAPPALFGAAEGETGGAIFSLNLGLVIWTWVLFLLTLGILVWKVFPLIAGGLEERQRKIQEAIDTAREDREEARRLVEEQTRELARARKEAQHLLDETREAAGRLRQELVADAEAEKADILERARREMERERERVLEQLREDTVEISLAAAERLIRTRLDAEADRAIVRDYVQSLEA
ncbi:MAG: F0F1 ATP synthase subunit B [Gemmatimonadota bacterium]|jgi:F-type H+-transporting ATPase subunit b|nr:MAG: F0F1 ATP synthase subunit B [Gemmatimonadota bacterium]